MKIYKIKVNGKTYKVELEAIDQVSSSVSEEKKIVKEETKKVSPSSSVGGTEVLSPIQGQITNIKVKVGDKIKKGEVLLLIEAMKLENEVVSPCDGEIASILVNKGQNVKAKDLVITIK